MPKFEKLLNLIEVDNVASKLKEDQLLEIGEEVSEDYKKDKDSMKDWLDMADNAIKFANQISDPKNFPFDSSSNIILPIVYTASTTFAARVYPEIIQGNSVANVAVFGEDPTGMKKERADRVKAHISYQLLVESDSWEPDTDQMLTILSVVGTCHKKVYYDSVGKKIESRLCHIHDVVVNHSVPSLEEAERVSHRFFLTGNQIVSKIRTKQFLDVELEDLAEGSQNLDRGPLESQSESSEYYKKKYEFIEQHRYLDLDKDGFEEPYIVTVHRQSQKVLSIFPRFTVNDIDLNESGDIVNIKAKQYFVDYHFLPNPDGGYYSIGYGQILYPLNKGANSLLNQLIDAGTLANTKAGLISRHFKVKGGKIEFRLGELIPVEPGMTGRIDDGIKMFEFSEPSQVTFAALQMLVESAKEIASINDVMSGQALPQNAPASSTFEIANQGQKVFGSIAKRIYRSLKKELKLIFSLNREFLDDEVYIKFQDQDIKVSREDYEDDTLDVLPVSDPKMNSDMRRSQQFMALGQMMNSPGIAQCLNLPELLGEFLKELKMPEETIKKIIIPPQQQQQKPSPDMMKAQIEAQKLQQKSQSDMMNAQMKDRELQLKSQIEMMKAKVKSDESSAKIAKMKADAFKDMMQAKHMDQSLAIQQNQVEVAKAKVHLESLVKAEKNQVDREKNNKIGSE